jgi:hypothetical protein
VGEQEARAWIIRSGATAIEAAGKIHSDIARGFIRAEVYKGEDLIQAGDMKTVKAQGKQLLHGKEYVVEEGDVLNIRFNV